VIHTHQLNRRLAERARDMDWDSGDDDDGGDDDFIT